MGKGKGRSGHYNNYRAYQRTHEGLMAKEYMRRDESIKELTELLPEEFLSEYTDAIKIGIEALEQEQCEDCISREAVIKTITEWLFSKEFYYTNATEYLRKRLDELPSVTPKPCEDCVSRQAAIDAIDALYLDGDSSISFRANVDGDALIGKYQAITALDDLPPVTPQPKMGRWIYTGDYITDGMLKCSECGFEHDVSEMFSYCPNCGAKMEVKE